jgi:probable blue pigment (indigoidine) exporter
MTTTTTASASGSTPVTAPGRTGLTVLTAMAPVVWGTTYIVTTELLPAGHPMFAALTRALPAGLLALLLSRAVPRGRWWWKALVLGTLNIGAFFPLLFLSAERLPGGVAATLGAVQPIIVAFLAVAILGERLSRSRVGWGVVGVIGVGLVVLGPRATLDPVGVLAGFAGAASMGLGVTLTKRWGRPAGVSAIGLAGWQLTAGGLVLLVPTLLIEGVPARIDPGAVAGYLWLGLIGGLLAYTVWFAGIRRLPVTATALLGLLSPLMAAALGVVVLDQVLTPVQLTGFALALVALVAGQLVPGGRTGQTSPAR